MFELLCFFLCFLLSTAFLTLMEHMMMGLVQIRLAPSKVSFFGFFQPIFDGLKLLQKEVFLLKNFLLSFYFGLPFLKFILSLFFFLLFLKSVNLKMDFLILFMMVGFMLYFFLLVSFFSKSKYSLLGAIRSAVQSLSFDIVFIFFLLFFLFFLKKIGLEAMGFYFMFLVFFVILLLMVLVELNRAPFDFSEGESELVSGYNLELGGSVFCLFFLAEYLLVIFYVFFWSMIFFNFNLFFSFFLFYLLIVVRSVWPRFRYDFLLSFFWLVLLPFIFILFFMFFLLV